MANMSYARFQNTLDDLDDCHEHLWDRNMSQEEDKARLRLVKLCIEIADEFGGKINDNDLADLHD